ncbi:HAD domain-containing protein [Streptomyces sp. NPDC050658]|uniref:HAD domain-containing protein n=1 Tax=unclassified Streptomyces TaxID=2593676 RepID=UPI003436D373
MISSPLPLLFLDVDGPLIPFGATSRELPDGYPTYEGESVPAGAVANPLIGRIDPAHGRRLRALPCALVWATTWLSDANDCVAPWLGLPQLPVVPWPDPSDEEPFGGDGPRGLHWKTRTIVDWAEGRTFAWVDDEITDTDRVWVAAHHPHPALLHRVDARIGLTAGDFAVLDAWLRAHGS